MIAKIKGQIEEILHDSLIITCSNGLSYTVFVSSDMLNNSILDENISLYISQITKEDGSTLYGFRTYSEKCWFEEFIKINGLGAKTAILILNYDISIIENAILHKDSTIFSNISGIGSKISTRICNEMLKVPEKISHKILMQKCQNKMENIKNKMKNNDINIRNDAIDVLINMGFDHSHIVKQVYEITQYDNSLSSQEIIKKYLAIKK